MAAGQFRNLGILAHVDAGKTTLTEQLLYTAGVIREAGSVDAGTTRTDSLSVERKRGISVRSATASLEWNGSTINIIDTPGMWISPERWSVVWKHWTLRFWWSPRRTA